MDGDIIINSSCLKPGDIFFCSLVAEEYLCFKSLDISSKIFVEEGFFLRLQNNTVSIKKNLSFKSKDLLNYIKINNLKSKIVEVKNFQEEIVFALKARYSIPQNILAVTGTKGKTSTAWYIFNLLNLCGLNAVYFGSIGFYKFNQNTQSAQRIKPLDFTTPFIDDIYRMLNEASILGCNYVVFEASNHAIDQDRFLGIDVNIGTFTNIGNDHLDYFKTFQAGFDAKKKLFSKYTKNLAVLNADIREYQELLEVCKKKDLKVITYGKAGDVKLLDISTKNFKQYVSFSFEGRKYSFLTSIIGSFQIYNILAAICNLTYFNINIDEIISKLNLLQAPVGRLELVKNSLNCMVYVDYSHTPESLFYTIQTLRELIKASNKKSQIITIFGCGGNRDRIKRPVMGFISTRLSDISIITNDNIRNENQDFIIEEIVKGINLTNENLQNEDKVLPFDDSMKTIKELFPKFKELKKNAFFIETDRKLAIKKALELMKEDDILLIAGKGHEDYQIIGDKKIYFSDYEEALNLLNLQK